MKRKRGESKYDNKPYKKPRLVKNGNYTPRVLGNPKSVGETKYHDSYSEDAAVQTVTTTWANTERDTKTGPTGSQVDQLCLFAPTIGDQYYQRDGRKCHVKAINIQGCVTVSVDANNAVAAAGARVRLYLYMDKQTNGAQSQGEDFIQSQEQFNPLDYYQNAVNFGRFKLLKKKTIKFGNRTIAGEFSADQVWISGDTKPFTLNYTFKKPVTVNFKATSNTGTVSDIVDNSFHVIMADDNASSFTILARYNCRVKFRD